MLSGSADFFCTQEGTWSVQGQCIARSTTSAPNCGSVPYLPNGQYSSGSETIGSVRQISCHTGYELEGSPMIFCLRTRTWTPPGSCVQRVITCENFPSISNGVVLPGGNQIGSSRRVQCNSGYEGSFSIYCSGSGEWIYFGSCNRGIFGFVFIIMLLKLIRHSYSGRLL